MSAEPAAAVYAWVCGLHVSSIHQPLTRASLGTRRPGPGAWSESFSACHRPLAAHVRFLSFSPTPVFLLSPMLAEYFLAAVLSFGPDNIHTCCPHTAEISLNIETRS